MYENPDTRQGKVEVKRWKYWAHGQGGGPPRNPSEGLEPWSGLKERSLMAADSQSVSLPHPSTL